MNMNSATRLDDKINSMLIAVAAALALGFGVDIFGGAALGTDGDQAVQLARAQAPAATPAIQVAMNTSR